MLTIFTNTKAFKGHVGAIQRNAISQWARLRPKPEILLFGTSEGTAEIAQEFSLRHIPEVNRNEYGTALLSDMFAKAHALASHDILCFINADIILLGDFMGAVQQVNSWHDRFLLVGRRTNVELDEPAIYESANQEGRLRAHASHQGRLGTPSAIDYFVFPRGLFATLPPFAIGRPGWDNWVLWRARRMKVPLVDASAVVLAVHQNHDYSHHPQGWQGVSHGEEARQNGALARHAYCTIEDATHKLTANGIEPHSRPFLSCRRQDARNWGWEFLRVTVPIRHLLGLRQQNIAGMLGKIRLPYKGRFHPLMTRTMHFSTEHGAGLDVSSETNVSSSASTTPRILTTQPKGFYPLWAERTVVLPGWLDEARRTHGRSVSLWHSVYWSWRLFRASKNFSVVVTGFERPWHIFALTRSLLRRDKPRHIIVFVNFTLPKGGLGVRFKRWYYRRVISSVDRTIVFSRCQVEMYSRVLGVSAEKFSCVPYHTTTDAYATGGRKPQFYLSEGEYIFAGGDSNRDYATLIEAARHLTYRVVIAARSRSHFRDLDIPANVEIVTVDPEHFLRLMAGAKVVAVPLRGGLAQGGQQTFLNAMAMGKPVVVSDDTGADEYITQGLTGLIVPPGDPVRLREALLGILENHEFRRVLGHAAEKASTNFSPEHFIQGVFAVIEGCLGGNL